MRIAIVGATGMVGSRLVTEARSRGHDVVAASRRPRSTPVTADDALPGLGLVTHVPADAGVPASLRPVLAGADAAVLTVRTAEGEEHTLAPLTASVLDAAADVDVPILVIGGAGPLRSPDDPARLVVDDPEYVAPRWRALALASTEQLEVCRRHGHAAWTYLSPPAVLTPGERTGRYRRGTGTLLRAPDRSSWISAEDLAVVALDEIERPGTNRHITAASATDR